jgi:glycosyltransferase involved in cell wall biosynthesis
MIDKIVIDGRLLSDHPTGISRYSHQLIQAFIKKFGNEKVYVIVNQEYSCLEDYNFIICRFKPYNPIHFIFFSYFVNKLHCTLYYSPFYSGIYYKSKTRKQAVTIHDLMYLKIDRYFSEASVINGISKFIFSLLVRFTLKSTDLVISVSETTRKDLLENFRINSVVVGEGVNQLIRNPKTVTPGKMASLLEVPYFLYIGNFRKQKNVDFLLKAYYDSQSDYRLVLVGDHQNKIVAADPHKVIFTGPLSDQEIQNLYEKCVAFVMPSLYEGFGLPILEAYCAGARVLASNQGALKEFDKLNIHYFSPCNLNELSSLLRNADQLAKPTEQQIKYARESYSWQSQTNKLVTNVEKLFAGEMSKE